MTLKDRLKINNGAGAAFNANISVWAVTFFGKSMNTSYTGTAKVQLALLLESSSVAILRQPKFIISTDGPALWQGGLT